MIRRRKLLLRGCLAGHAVPRGLLGGIRLLLWGVGLLLLPAIRLLRLISLICLLLGLLLAPVGRAWRIWLHVASCLLSLSTHGCNHLDS